MQLRPGLKLLMRLVQESLTCNILLRSEDDIVQSSAHVIHHREAQTIVAQDCRAGYGNSKKEKKIFNTNHPGANRWIRKPFLFILFLVMWSSSFPCRPIWSLCLWGSELLSANFSTMATGTEFNIPAYISDSVVLYITKIWAQASTCEVLTTLFPLMHYSNRCKKEMWYLLSLCPNLSIGTSTRPGNATTVASGGRKLILNTMMAWGVVRGNPRIL